jgi:hypothetical protein
MQGYPRTTLGKYQLPRKSRDTRTSTSEPGSRPGDPSELPNAWHNRRRDYIQGHLLEFPKSIVEQNALVAILAA